jgi:hypothetical protein
MLLLRGRLKELGATDAQQSEVLSAMRANLGSNLATSDIVAALRTIIALAHQVRESITSDILPPMPANDDRSSEADKARSVYAIADSLRRVVSAIEGELSYYEHYISDEKKTIPTPYLTQRIDAIRGELEQSMHSMSGAEWLLNHQGLRTPLYQLELEMIDTDLKLGHLNWSSGTELQKQINDFLIARSGQARSAAAAPEDTSYTGRGMAP